MAVAPTPVAAAPDAPDRAQRATFSARATAFFDWIKNTFVAGVNALATITYNNAQESAASAATSAASATDALVSKAAAEAAAAQATLLSGAPDWVSGTTYTIGQVRRSLLANRLPYERITAGAGTTDPASDATNWRPAGLSISTSLPSARPALSLPFAAARRVDPRITFTRTSTATRINERGLMEAVPANIPRIDHDPVTGECKGLLIEEARTNLLTYSEQFDNASWTKTRATVTANAATSPDGTADADKLVEDTTAASNHYVYTYLAKAASAITYTASAYFKAAERSSVLFGIYGGTSGRATAVFNLSAGTYSGLTTTSGWTAATAEITSAGNGWYRCAIAATSNTDNRVDFQVSIHNGTTDAYTGDGTSGLYLFGAQLETGKRASSYIPTTGSAATRAADVLVLSGANFSDWYNPAEGAFVVRFSSGGSTQGDNDAAVLCATNASDSHYPAMALLYNDQGYNRAVATLYDALGASQLSGTYSASNSLSLGITAIAALTYRVNDVQLVLNGALAGANDTSVSLATGLDRLHIGSYYAAGNRPLNGHIEWLAYYSKRLSAAELMALTLG